MDFAYSVEQRELIAYIRAFARARFGAGDTSGHPSPQANAAWLALGRFGLLGAAVPESLGGLGLDALTTAAAIEALSRECPDTGLVFAACAHLFACAMPIVHHGTPAQQAAWLPRLCAGELVGANAITEPEAGSDVFALRSRAERRGEDYVLNGVKNYVTNGPECDVMLVYASTAPGHGYLGISAFLVERGAPGLRIGAPLSTLGLAGASVASVYMDECIVPARNLLGSPGEGHAIFNTSMRWERACLFAAYLGTMQRQLDAVIDFANSRRQNRRPIGKNQAISHRIADMAVRLTSVRLLVQRACWLLDRGDEEAGLAISMAKLAVSEAAVQSGLDAIQIHGGLGVMRETGVPDGLLDALPARIFSGTSEVQRDLIARGLGL